MHYLFIIIYFTSILTIWLRVVACLYILPPYPRLGGFGKLLSAGNSFAHLLTQAVHRQVVDHRLSLHELPVV